MLMMNCQGSSARVLLLLLCSEATITVPLTAAHQSTLNSTNAAEKDLETEWRQVQYISIYLALCAENCAPRLSLLRSHSLSLTGADPKGGWGAPAPLQLVQQWRYGEGEGEEEVEERRK
jgi:hypothetical protein